MITRIVLTSEAQGNLYVCMCVCGGCAPKGLVLGVPDAFHTPPITIHHMTQKSCKIGYRDSRREEGCEEHCTPSGEEKCVCEVDPTTVRIQLTYRHGMQVKHNG